MTCRELETLVLPEGLETMSYYAINDCPKLTSVTIPATVTTIAIGNFEGCPNVVVHTPAGSAAAQYCAGQDVPYVTE